MSETMILGTGIAVLFAAMSAPWIIGRSDLIGKGRVFSRPLWRYAPFRPIRFGPYVRTGHVRGGQFLILGLLTLALAFGSHIPYAVWVYDFGGAALYLDDLLTDDDDHWDGLRRRIKRAIAVRPRLRVRPPVPSPA